MAGDFRGSDSDGGVSLKYERCPYCTWGQGWDLELDCHEVGN